MKSPLYETDFLRWTEEQAVLLRAGRLAEIDVENLIKEIEDIGIEQQFALQSLFRQIIIHLLKLNFSPTATVTAEAREAWIDEVSELRDQTEARIRKSPSLKHYTNELLLDVWHQARRRAQRALRVHNENIMLPIGCPYSIEQLMDSDYFPPSNAVQKN